MGAQCSSSSNQSNRKHCSTCRTHFCENTVTKLISKVLKRLPDHQTANETRSPARFPWAEKIWQMRLARCVLKRRLCRHDLNFSLKPHFFTLHPTVYLRNFRVQYTMNASEDRISAELGIHSSPHLNGSQRLAAVTESPAFKLDD